MNNNGDILTMEQAAETIMRTAVLLMDGRYPIRDMADVIMQKANELRHLIMELEKEL